MSKRSFIDIQKKRGPRNYPWGTPALTLAHEEYWPFKTTLGLLASTRSIIKVNTLPLTPFYFNLEMSTFCQTLSVAFDISKKTSLTSYPSSKDS